MFKNVIAPIQAWLLSQGKCVGCGMLISNGDSKKTPKGIQFTCKCKRVYFKTNEGKYRRALLSEIVK